MNWRQIIGLALGWAVVLATAAVFVMAFALRGAVG